MTAQPNRSIDLAKARADWCVDRLPDDGGAEQHKARWFDDYAESLLTALEQMQERADELETALAPLAELFDFKVNLNDPISKWLTMSQLQGAADALAKDTPHAD